MPAEIATGALAASLTVPDAHPGTPPASGEELLDRCQAIELDTRPQGFLVVVTADRDHAALRRGDHALDQPIRQHEMPEMVYDEVQLEHAHLAQLAV